MSKDQAKGVVLFLVCVALALGYVVLLFAPQPFISLLGSTLSTETLHFWLVAIPVLVIFLTVMFIGAWIGWTMVKSPPPKAIVEQETESAR